MSPPPSEPPPLQPKHSASRLVWIYAAFASLWITLSDQVVAWLVSDPFQLARISTFKGWFFVAITTWLLHTLLRRLLAQITASEDQHRVLLDFKTRRTEALLDLSEASQHMDERGFMQYGQELAEQLTGSQIAFIHLVHEDQETIELVAWSKATLANYCTAAYDNHYPVSQAGIWADALRQRAPVVINDYATATGKHGLPAGHAHLARLISVPVMDGGLVRMMTGVGNKSTRYDEQDVETVRLISDAIWHIVQQRRSQAALRKSEYQLQLVTHNIQDVIWTADLQGKFTYISPAVELLSGFKPEELLGKNLSAIVAAEDAAEVRQAIAKVIADHAAGLAFSPLQREIEQPCKDGSRVWIEVNVNGMYDDKAQLIGMVGVIRNIAKRKEQDRLLQLANQVFEQSQEGITVTDAAGTIVAVNAAFSRITGYDRAEVVGQNPRILHSGRQDAAYYRAMWDALTSVGRWSSEIWNKRKDGTIYPEWLAISALRDLRGQTTHFVANFSDLSQSKAAESRIQWLSYFDPLTGLPNRTLLQDRTALTLSMVQRANEPLTMMLVALDHFSTINDTMGHHLGDQLLVETARRLSVSVREQDTVAHLGGKEFVLVLPGTDQLGATHLATEMLGNISQPCKLGDREVSVTASIGIVSYPENGTRFEDLFRAVEIAMRNAQAKGRNTYAFFSTELYDQVLAHEAMTQALRQAIANQELSLVYQPQVDLQTGQICGLEALLRWTHPEYGQVSPVQFIPLAEKAGLIISIGEWVLNQACQDVRHWLDLGIMVPHVAINASPLQFRDNDFVAQVRSALNTSGIDPAQIYIEVTESALMDDVPRNEAMLHALKELGIQLSLDDFGTGYSSLSYLKRFPFDQVKIDQSFVRDIATNPSDMMLVKVIISMAHGLGMKAIAEGVETEAQCDIMRTSLCDEIQGYFFSKPVKMPEIEQLFSEARQLPEHLLRQKKPQRTLLLVDDEANILSALKRLLRRDGHQILTANNGAEGLKILAEHRVDIILSDQRMPGMTGVDFLRAAKALYPDTIRIVLSGYTELQSVTDAINEGAVYRFLTKPWDDDALREQINKAIEYRQVIEDNRQLENQVYNTNRELMAANRKLKDLLQQLQAGQASGPGCASS
ncbi:MAG: EAL domain-containing protein [Betaproteobacteria bacterium]|nr:EAL domain-containing protein [Betaproteobacteria bacterium]NCP80974.1 EAL domain-containing protein [Rhodoferax sp.]NCS60256.1 EAL domain-containing protein [Rhodoferax sp.]PIZ23312.1 MAG: hypothetical protein COY49_03915 [Comamonadaceae bacterium CG_4_10_14_0_8_um_filter_57_29]PJC16391.1 MAG: hypothetical protein CO065_10280 [Comamonadaceae bacterium CG_4_9_14_0_8_um_filter_57_21]